MWTPVCMKLNHHHCHSQLTLTPIHVDECIEPQLFHFPPSPGIEMRGSRCNCLKAVNQCLYSDVYDADIKLNILIWSQNEVLTLPLCLLSIQEFLNLSKNHILRIIQAKKGISSLYVVYFRITWCIPVLFFPFLSFPETSPLPELRNFFTLPVYCFWHCHLLLHSHPWWPLPDPCEGLHLRCVSHQKLFRLLSGQLHQGHGQ